MTLASQKPKNMEIPSETPNFSVSAFDVIVYILLFVAAGAFFLEPTLQMVCGPILAFLFVYLYFVKKDTLFVTLFIILANDALGTVVLGKISFQYLLIPLVLLELLERKKISVRSFFLLLLGIVMILQPALTGVATLKSALITLFYVFALLLQQGKYEQRFFIERFMFSFSLIVGLIALHAIITGGVVFDEAILGAEDISGLRRGILGVGSGDPNFSGLLLCAGIACALNSKTLPRIAAAIAFLLCLGAIVVTMSTTTLIALLIVLFMTALINAPPSKAVIRILLLVLAFILLFNLYTALPAEWHTEQIDAYIVRMEEKWDALLVGDLDSVTTNRSTITEQYWDYLTNEQSLVKQIFGGNSINLFEHVPHNTYMDFLLQFGFLGTAFLLIFIFKRLLQAFFLPKDRTRKVIVTLKILYAVFIFSISVFTESTFALTFVFLFVL